MEQEVNKKKKVDEDKETTKLQSLIEVISDEEEVAIDDVPLATKPPTIVDWKIHKEGKKSYYQIIRADGKSQMIVGIKRLLDDLRVIVAQISVTAAKLNTASIKLVLLVKIEENILSSYYCLCSVNAAGV
ncbi:hypothetical protein Tco_0356590 [Tanacetum coccineum]